eukprot:Phypoly_transcript_03700.p1 GENE.Phypoly_transcript_03700~~Phypoly_transcript_03700.p1  ORF type:complete len:686 (+),score=119.73 Phypoly_transcript_03700:176-2233(+)
MASSKASQALNDLLEKDIVPDDVDMQVEEDGEPDGTYVNNHVPSSQGMCAECGDQVSSVACDQCEDEFCDLCYKAMHRKGARKQHTHKRLRDENKANDTNNNNTNNNNKDSSESDSEEEEEDEEMEAGNKENKPVNSDDDDEGSEPSLKRPSISRFPYTSATATSDRYYAMSNYTAFGKANSYYNKGNTSIMNMYNQKPPPPPENKSPAEKYIPSIKKDGPWFEDRAKYIPLRLTMDERKALRLLEASLHVCDYTDHVDVAHLAASKPKRIVQQLKEICAILCGIRSSIDLESGKEMVVNRDFSSHAEFYQAIFEIGRRHKIMNPEKMRTEYGKLIYLLQDSMTPEIQDLIKFSMVHPVLTVHSFLSERGAVAMLHDPFMEIATREIVPEGKDRYDIQDEIKQKEKAIKMLSKKYVSDKLSSTDIERCLYSIGDNHSFLRGARDPIDKMIVYLTAYFKPEQIEGDYSLAISAGVNGARLTHNHSRQYHYVLQSLTLWREVTHDMFKLWILAEDDLLESGNNYRLKDTGQGLNRIQSAHRISKAMTYIVNKVQSRVGDNWVGSSVVHLGDHNVPNALMFIDKYTQISRILNPIIIALRRAADLMKDENLADYVQYKFGSLENCRKEILCDFFKFAFDGSGADNFFDAGSCIDGRLTSAWHWCSQIDKKAFYPIFLLTGFIGFDGQF